MENCMLIGTVLAIQVFAWFTPGPLFVLIVRNSLVYSRKSGVWTAAGIGIGTFVHITYAVISILFVVSISTAAFSVIKFLGVGYLTYLGIKTFLANKDVNKTYSSPSGHTDIAPLKAAQIGFMANILSPKASLFFASIFATVIVSGAPLWAVVLLWIAMSLNSFVMASVLSVFFTQQSIRSAYAKYQHIVNKLLGVALLALAIMIALHK